LTRKRSLEDRIMQAHRSRTAPGCAAIALVFALCAPASRAHDTAQPAARPGRVVTPLMSHPLAGTPGKVTQMLTIEYAPGFEAPSHTHPGPLYGYVLEGAFTTELDGQPRVTYTKGQAFFEPAGAVHRVSRNPSPSEPLKLLIFIVADEGQPLAAPVKP
jgi:quercetin dioxygenase-like cupin family protein